MPADIAATVTDARDLQNLFINTLGVLPENSIVMATEDDKDKIIQQIDVSLGLDRQADKPYFKGPESQIELQK